MWECDCIYFLSYHSFCSLCQNGWRRKVTRKPEKKEIVFKGKLDNIIFTVDFEKEKNTRTPTYTHQQIKQHRGKNTYKLQKHPGSICLSPVCWIIFASKKKTRKGKISVWVILKNSCKEESIFEDLAKDWLHCEQQVFSFVTFWLVVFGRNRKDDET